MPRSPPPRGGGRCRGRLEWARDGARRDSLVTREVRETTYSWRSGPEPVRDASAFTSETFVAILRAYPPSRMPMPELLPYLDAAAAHPDFKREVLDFVQGAPAARIELKGYAPRVKVERVLTQLLHKHPTLRVERVRVTARSGCSDFSGEI